MAQRNDEGKFTRMTKQKAAILEIFRHRREKLMTAEEVTALLDGQGTHIGLATVYRNLRAFEEEGRLIKVIESTDAPIRYRFGSDFPKAHTHRKLICVECGRIESFPIELSRRIERMTAQETKYAICDHQILFYGVCPKCKALQKKASQL